MDLRDRGCTDRDGIDRGEQFRRIALEGAGHRGVDCVIGHGRQRVLQPHQIVRRRFADNVGPRRQRLAEFDRGGADRLERIGITRHGGYARAQPRDPGEAAHRGGRVRVTLDARKRAMPREDATPFQQAPEVDSGGGHFCSPPACGRGWGRG
ncbi:hypothetical protein D9M73_102450 [compost metagenome]